MDILFLLIPLSIVLAFFIGAFFWRAVDTGQFDDLDTPALDILDDAPAQPRAPATPPVRAGDDGA